MVPCLAPVGFANQALLDKGNTTQHFGRSSEETNWSTANQHTPARPCTQTGWMVCGQETGPKTFSLYSCAISNHSGWLAIY